MQIDIINSIKIMGIFNYLKWKFEQFAWFTRHNFTTRCYDCGLLYRDFPCDMVINDSLWIRISPHKTDKEAGLLCPNCICKRLIKEYHLTCVHVKVEIDGMYI